MTQNTKRCAQALVVAAFATAMGVQARADATGPYVLGDTISGVGSGMSVTTPLIASGKAAYFKATNNTLWRTNGRPGGTSQIDINISGNPIAVPSGGLVYMRGNATGGSSLHYVNEAGEATLIAQPMFALANTRGTTPAITLGSKVIFSVSGTHLMSWDTVTGGTEDLGTDFLPTTSSDFLVVGQKAFAVATIGSNVSLRQTDGTAAGTSTVSNISGTLYTTSSPLQNGGTGVYFLVRKTVPTVATEMWRSDGTLAGTVAAATVPSFTGVISSWSTPGVMGLYYSGIVSSRTQLWHFGTAAEDTGLLLDFPSTARFANIGSANGLNVFLDTSSTYVNGEAQARMWITNGTPGQTLIGPSVGGGTQDTFTGAPVGSAGSSMGVSNGDEVYFMGRTTAAGTEPWHVNMTTGSIGMIQEITPGTASPLGTKMFQLGFERGVGVLAPYNQNSPIATGPGVYFLKPGSPARFVGLPTTPSTSTPIVAIGNRIVMGITSPNVGMEPHAIDLCPADYDNGGTLDSSDVFGFLNDWLAANRNADFDKSGGAPAIGDIFGFLNAWLTGCPS